MTKLCQIDGDQIKITYEEEDIKWRRKGDLEIKRHRHIVSTSHQMYEEKKDELKEKLEKYKAKPASEPD